MIEFNGPDEDDEADDEFEDTMDTDLDESSEIVQDAVAALATMTIPVPVDPIRMVGPFEVRLNDVYDGEGRSVMRCGYLHNTRASGPPIAEVVCAALNRYHGIR